MNDEFFAGSAKIDITPPLGTMINGDFTGHYAKYVHDNLFARALVLKDSITTVAFVVVDICVMQRDLLDLIKWDISEQVGIESKNVVISSTHTHAGGSVADLLLATTDISYRNRLPALIVEAVRSAFYNLRPAKIAFGSVDAPEHIVCRRYYMKKGYQALNPVTGGIDQVKTNPAGDENQIERPASLMDTELSFLAVRGIDGHWISVLANYCLHYVGDFEAGTVTADYFGVFASQLANLLSAGEDFTGIMSNGTSGEANIWDFINPDRYPKGNFEKSVVIGKDLANKVFKALQDIEWDMRPTLASQYEEIKLQVRKPAFKEIQHAQHVVSSSDYEKIVLNEEGYVRIYAREQLLLNEYPDTILFPVQSFKIGSGIIGCLSGEFFAETGLWLKEMNAGKKYFTVCLANGYVGYVPPAHEIKQGGYETWRCRSSYLELHAESMIRARLMELIERLQ